MLSEQKNNKKQESASFRQSEIDAGHLNFLKESNSYLSNFTSEKPLSFEAIQNTKRVQRNKWTKP